MVKSKGPKFLFSCPNKKNVHAQCTQGEHNSYEHVWNEANLTRNEVGKLDYLKAHCVKGGVQGTHSLG